MFLLSRLSQRRMQKDFISQKIKLIKICEPSAERYCQQTESLRSHQLLSYPMISQKFMEPEGSLLCSQEPATGPYPKPD
jgi:hypothetical protein